MQIVDDSASAQVEEIFAGATVARSPSLPPANMGQGMLHSYPFTQGLSTCWRSLTLSQFHEQRFIRVNADAAPFGTGSTLPFQGTLSTGFFGKMHDATRHKGHLLFRWTANDLSVPIEGKHLLGEVLSLAHRPGFAIDLQFSTAFPHQLAAQIGSVDMHLFQSNRLSSQIRTDGLGDAGFWDIRRSDTNGADQTRIEIME